MNDFTKEELTKIARALVATYSDPKVSLNKPEMDLVNKVEQMINDYCDHEWENICCQCSLDKIYCHKCEKDMGDL